jgi:8-oxo-dGTP diphosphatase
MAFHDQYRLSAHAVITNDDGHVLLLKATYGELSWGLPGGAIDLGESIHDCISRECQEELGIAVTVQHLTGVYCHQVFNSHVFIFRAHLPAQAQIKLSAEHSEFAYFAIDQLSAIQQQRINDCLQFDGEVRSAKF